MERFRDALSGPGFRAIAEVKRRSPSAGELRAGRRSRRARGRLRTRGRSCGLDFCRRTLRRIVGRPTLRTHSGSVAAACQGLLLDRGRLEDRARSGRRCRTSSSPRPRRCGCAHAHGHRERAWPKDVAVAAEAGPDLAWFVLAEASPRQAPGVLPVPETMFSVAVVVGSRATMTLTLSSCTRRSPGRSEGAMSSCSETGARWRASWISPGARTTQRISTTPGASMGGSCSQETSTRRTCGRQSTPYDHGLSMRAHGSRCHRV